MKAINSLVTNFHFPTKTIKSLDNIFTNKFDIKYFIHFLIFLNFDFTNNLIFKSQRG